MLCVHRRSLCVLLFLFIIIPALLVTQTSLDDSIVRPLGRLRQHTDTGKPTPLYKAISSVALAPIVDAFPLAASAKSPSDLPPIPSWNTPPTPHVNESTPLFIGFTRNWPLLQQTVVSYIVAGWPPEDIYVVENTGVMHSNRHNLLTLQNPFYLDYHRLTKLFLVNVISTPTLFTFAQLQNFYTFTALENGWSHYWWAHMDTVVLSDEQWSGEPYKSLYLRALDALRETMDPAWGPLATRWFASLDNLERLYQRGAAPPGAVAKREGATGIQSREPELQRNSVVYQDLVHDLNVLQNLKSDDIGGRNTWQARQRGGQGEPFYRDPEGFEKGIWMWMDFGRDVFTEKWGRGPCDLRQAGLEEDDAWRLVKDWENPEVQDDFRRKAKAEEKKRAKEIRMKEKSSA